MKYPKAERTDVIDDYHGVAVADPYRYMEDENDPRTKKFIEENNALFEDFIDKQVLNHYKKEYRRFNDYAKYEFITRHDDIYYYLKNDGLMNQPIIYRKKGLDGTPEVLLDINTLSEDGTTSSINRAISKNHQYLVTTLSVHGSDWQTIYIKDLETGQEVEKLEWVRFTGMEWKNDSSGFYYQRFPDQTTIAPADKNKHAKAYFHKIGTAQSEDQLVFEPQDKDYSAYTQLSDDNKYLFIYSSNSTMPENELYVRKEENSDFQPLIPTQDGNAYYIIEVLNNTAYMLTSKDAPNKRIVKINLDSFTQDKAMEDVIPESEYPISSVSMTKNYIIVSYIVDAKHKLSIYNNMGEKLRDVPLPIEIGSVAGLFAKMDSNEIVFTFSSYTVPSTLYSYNIDTDTLKQFHELPLQINSDTFSIQQVFYESKDSTKIPMYIIHKKGIQLEGNTKTILYGYGGFDIALTPGFNTKIMVWLEQGYIYAIANIRGGGEYGEKWHQAALLENKQNVFDDFIAAAEYLIENKYTSTSKLAINGRSNGGLLISAVLTQRPDLFGATVPQVGVLDMYRFSLYTIGRYWIPEYGDAINNAEHFKFLSKYSPLHNIQEISYPPTLITAAEGDNRVAPAHSLKFAAELQNKQQGDNPILLRIEKKAGHGFGKSVTQIIEDEAVVYAFLEQVL